MLRGCLGLILCTQVIAKGRMLTVITWFCVRGVRVGILASLEFRFRRKYGTFGVKFTEVRSKLRCVKIDKSSVKIRRSKRGKCEFTWREVSKV